MKFKRLEINGFKSFLDKTTIHLDPRITCVVGPNGCGKSNVVDAIRWAMGEQSYKHLRGKSMEDVIFNGSDNHAPLGMAEVFLTFENDGKGVPPQYASFPEITVGRRLFRGGDSEYIINKTTVRHLDVIEFFLGTGVGTKAYSIVEQEKVHTIVTSKPEDRRALIEEAAGITKYRARRRVAEKKMENTRNNLLRVKDIIQENQKRLNQLERQAQMAERYRQHRAEIREIELRAAAWKFRDLRRAVEELSASAADLEQRNGALQSAIAAGEAAIQAAWLDITAKEHGLQTLQEESSAADRRVSTLEASIQFQIRERENLEKQRAELLNETARLKIQIEEHTQALAEQEEILRGLGDQHHIENARLGELLETQRGLQTAAREISEASEHRKNESVRCLTGIAGKKTALENTGRRRIEFKGRQARLQVDLEGFETERERLRKEAQAQEEKLRQRRQTRLDLTRQTEAQQETLNQLRAELMGSEAGIFRLKEEIAEKRSRYNSLQDIQNSYEGFADGVRNVMSRAKEGGTESGIHGLVADVVETQPRFEAAVEAVLGERLQYIVVQSQEQGVDAIEFLKARSAGRSSFIPVQLRLDLPGDRGEEPPGVLTRVMDVVSYRDEYREVVNYLLGDVSVVETLPRALEMWNANGYSRTLVTLDGEIINPQGVVSGGSMAGVKSGFLQRKREIKELHESILKLETEFQLTSKRRDVLKSRVAQVEAGLANLRQETMDADIGIVNEEKDLQRHQADLKRIGASADSVRREVEEIAAAAAAMDREEQAAREAIQTLEDRRAALENELNELAREGMALREQLEGLNAEVTGLRVKVAAGQERRHGAESNIQRLKTEIASSQHRLERAYQNISSINQRLTALQEGQAAAENELRELLEKTAVLTESLRLARSGYETGSQGLRDREAALRDKRREAAMAAEQLNRVTLDLHGRKAALHQIAEQTRERYQIDVETLEAPAEEPGPGEHEKVRVLRERCERMGQINLLAIEEYEEVSKKLEFLNSQFKDLESSLNKLEKAIQKINRTSRERYVAAFEAINARFREVFPKLFQGGHAELRMVGESKDPLELGVEIVAQPPGMQVRTLDLLSGGQKALTAVSLIFSIFLVKPSPFCLMDEVDAPLDDMNIGRFNGVVNEMAALSQFVLITHNKRTMEIADTLYGVTMEEPGISRVISVQLKQAAGGAVAAR
ncbi:MAG: Chromosome partition protein Smc [Myxococcota bacterium]|nr:Chromosome partition protein Smc [Myxococcota bacterium]